MSIIIEATNLQTQNVTRGKLSFVDLAGSERCYITLIASLARMCCDTMVVCSTLASSSENHCFGLAFIVATSLTLPCMHFATTIYTALNVAVQLDLDVSMGSHCLLTYIGSFMFIAE